MKAYQLFHWGPNVFWWYHQSWWYLLQLDGHMCEITCQQFHVQCSLQIYNCLFVALQFIWNYFINGCPERTPNVDEQIILIFRLFYRLQWCFSSDSMALGFPVSRSMGLHSERAYIFSHMNIEYWVDGIITRHMWMISSNLKRFYILWWRSTVGSVPMVDTASFFSIFARELDLTLEIGDLLWLILRFKYLSRSSKISKCLYSGGCEIVKVL